MTRIMVLFVKLALAWIPQKNILALSAKKYWCANSKHAIHILL